MARNFDGTDDFVTPSVGALSGIVAATPWTLVAIVKLGDTTDGALIYLATSTIGNGNACIEVDSGDWYVSTTSASFQTMFSASTANNWTLIAASKAAGTSTPRVHKYVYDTGTWTHADAGGTITNGSGTTGNVRIGRYAADSRYINGDIAAAGVFNRVLTDDEVERLAFSFQAWVAAAPLAGWLFDQQSTGQLIDDWTGGGAGQSAITGTTVSTNSVPVFGYGMPVRSVTREAGSADATITPSVITATTSFPAGTVSGGATVAPSAILATTTMPAPTVEGDTGMPAPDAILATTSFPAATVSGGATVAPAAITATTSMGGATVSAVDPPPVACLIQFAYGADPDTDLSAAVWTDVTERVRYAPAVSIRAGRHGLGATTDPLMIRLTLDNRDGQFTPFLNTGTNFPSITRNLPLRVKAALGGDTPVEQATGFVDSFELGWDESTNNCVVFIVAVGRLARLARKKVAISSTTATIAATSPVAYWPLTDGTSATSAASGLVGGSPMAKAGTLKFGTGDGGAGQPNILDLGELPETPGKLIGTIPAGTSSTSWRVEFKLNWPRLTAPSDARGPVSWTTAGTISNWAIDYDLSDDAVKLRYVLADGSGETSLLSTFTDPYDGVARRYRVTADQDGTGIDVVLYVNDVAVITQTIPTQTLGRPTEGKVRAGYNFSGGFDGTSMPAVGEFTFWAPYASSVDTTQAAEGYVGEMAGDRIARLCDEAGVPVLVVDGATAAMGIQQPGNLLELLRECETADGGLLHDNGPDGSLVYIPRSAYYNALVDLTVDVDLRRLQPGFRPVYDGRDRLTAAVVSQPSGSSGSYELPEGEGDEARSFTLNLDDSENLSQHAAWRVNLGSVEGMRYPKVGLDFRRSTELVDTWQSTGGIGMRLDVTNLPQQHPPLPVEQFADGYDLRLSEHMWRVDLDCVPASPYEVIVLDTTASTLVSAVDADDVTFTSVVSRPPRWTTTDEPIALQVGGETPIIATTIADTAIEYVSGNTVTHANNASLSPALPASMAAGDLILLYAAIRGTAATVDVPTGYTRLAGWHNAALLGKIHTGSESAPTVTFTGGAAGDTTSCAMFAARNTVSDIDHVLVDFTDYNNNASSSVVAIPPLTTQRMWDGCILFYFVAQSEAWTSLAALSGFTEVLDSASALGNNQSVAAGYQIQTTATAIVKTDLAITGGASAVSRSLIVAIAPGRSVLTVTRATNGTATSHAAGGSIQVADTGNLGLGGGA